MVNDERWYKDTGALLHELRRVQQDNQLPTIEGYDLVREIARGGQGVVYEAIQGDTKCRVAIKILLEGVIDSNAGRIRFEREIDLARGLRHAHVVNVQDFGTTQDNRLYFVMPFIEGQPLDAFVAQQKEKSGGILHITSTMELFEKICQAVSYAHQKGVIHRDLKPSNIRIDEAGEPHVLDFGLAKMFEEAPGSQETVSEGDMSLSEVPGVSITGQFLGSLPWASPEQAEGSHKLMDIRSDVYSLGVMLYQVFTDRFPYEVTGPLREALENIVSAEPANPSDLNRQVDDDLETIILKCLAKMPDRRYQSMGELSRDLRHYLNGEPIEAKRDSAWYTIRKTMARHKFAMGSAASFVLFLAGFGLTMTLLMNRAVNAESLAQQRLVELETEAEKVEFVNEFMLNAMVFNNAPDGTLADITVNEMLDNAVAQIDTTPWIQGKPAVIAEVHNNFSYWLARCRRYEEAKHHQLVSLQLRTEVYGEGDKRLYENYRALRYASELLESVVEEIDYARKCIEVNKAQPEQNWDWLAQDELILGVALLKHEQPDEALAAAQRAQIIIDESLEPDTWQSVLVHQVRGMALLDLDRLEEAEIQLLRCYKRSLAKWGMDSLQLKDVAKDLITLYEVWGKPEAATQYQDLIDS
ncbi:MAG: protein kinase [Planctomycetota bacterium]|nr:protein kinase [Planctomycetota bacterium]